MSKTSLKNFLLIHGVFILVILDVLAGNVRDVGKELKRFNNQTTVNEDALHVKRFEKLKDKLPGEGILGYFTNRGYSADDDARFFYLTQYALSPLIIVRSTEPQTIIADVRDSFNSDKFSKKHNCYLLKNFGDGILLFRKRTE